MTHPPPAPAPGSGAQLVAILLVTLFVMVLGVLVVVAPDRMGVPRPPATPAATPVESDVGGRTSDVTGQLASSFWHLAIRR